MVRYVLRCKLRKGFRNNIFFADLSLDVSERKISQCRDLELGVVGFQMG